MVFRSRSALRSLFQVDVERDSKAGGVAWFSFERDVQSLMKSLGFSVAHVAASRCGDDGVDIFATKGADLDEVRWVIQCKCYSSKNKVGPAAIREILGALRPHPPGTRAMVVTTSSFTAGASELAAAEGVRLMDGAEFATRLRASL